MRPMHRILIPASLLGLLCLTGCAQHIYAPGPGMSPEAFGPDSARCRLFARGSQRDFEFGAYGSPKFVAASTAAAGLAYAIGTAIETDQNFDDCMQARGWRPVSPAEQATAATSRGVADQAKADLIACRRTIFAKPEYAILARHFAVDGVPTVAHLTDETVPTPEEVHVIPASFDELATCQNQYIAAARSVRPDVAPMLQNAWNDSVARAALLTQRKITWGESTRRGQAKSQESVRQQSAPTVNALASAQPERRSFGVRANNGARGIVLLEVDPRGAASQAGLREGDEITWFNGTATLRQDDIERAMATIRPGSSVVATIRRNGAEQSVTINF